MANFSQTDFSRQEAINRSEVPQHRHTGVDSPKISAKNLTDVSSLPFIGSADALTEVVTSSKLSVGDLAVYLPDLDDTTFVQLLSTNSNTQGLGANNTNNKFAIRIKAPIDLTLDEITIYSPNKVGTPTDNFRISIASDNTGDPGTYLDSRTYDESEVTGADIAANFNTNLTADTDYWLVLDRTGANDAANYWTFTYSTTNEGSITSALPFYEDDIYDSTGGSWATGSGRPIRATFKCEVSEGYYPYSGVRTNLDMGRAIGVVESVSGTDCTLVLAGKISLTGMTAGELQKATDFYWGYSITTTTAYVFARKYKILESISISESNIGTSVDLWYPIAYDYLTFTQNNASGSLTASGADGKEVKLSITGNASTNFNFTNEYYSIDQ